MLTPLSMQKPKHFENMSCATCLYAHTFQIIQSAAKHNTPDGITDRAEKEDNKFTRITNKHAASTLRGNSASAHVGYIHEAI